MIATKFFSVGAFAASALAASVSGVFASPDAGPDTPPSISSVVVMNTPGGGLSPFLSSDCSVAIKYTDSSPSFAEQYTADVVNADTSEVVGTYSDYTFGEINLYCGDFTDGTNYTVAVTEEGGVTTPTSPFTYSVVGHPGSIWVTSQVVNGVDGFKPGKKQVISFRDGGAWESGISYSTQVWVSKTPTFTDADSRRNTMGTDAILQVNKATSPTLSFTVPTTAEGEYVWYSLLAHKAGKVDYRFSFSAVPVHPLPNQPTSWIKSFGTKSGKPVIGSTVKVSAPVYSTAGKKQNLAKKYRWFVTSHSQAVAGATNSHFKPTGALRDLDLSLRVTISDNDHASRIKYFDFGKVQ